jgi:hypothetical protein
MVSIHGYFEWYDLNKGFNDIKDYRGTILAPQSKPDTIVTALDNNNFKYYRYLVDKSKLQSRYDDSQASFTIFAPRDDTLDENTKRFITNADINMARKLVDFSTIPRIIREKTLNEYGVYWADTRNSPERILVDNRPGMGLKVSGHHVLSGNLGLKNGIVYQISGLLIPSTIL